MQKGEKLTGNFGLFVIGLLSAGRTSKTEEKKRKGSRENAIRAGLEMDVCRTRLKSPGDDGGQADEPHLEFCLLEWSSREARWGKNDD